MDKFTPKMEEKYWYIDNDSLPYSDTWVDAYIDNERLSIGNVFINKDDIIYELGYRKVIKELKQFSDDFKLGKCNHFITYDYLNEYITIHYDNIYKHSGIYFESEDKAWKAVETVGRDRVLKYYLRVKG